MEAKRIDKNLLPDGNIVYFGTVSATLDESDRYYTVSVYREGDISTSASVDIHTIDMTALYGKDAHAWVEVYIEGVGWIPVEVTAPKSPVRISLKIPTGSAEQVYNGNTISNPNINWSSMASVNGNNGWRYDIANGRCVNDNTGHWFSIAGVSATGRLTDVNEAGINNNASGVVIYDAEGNNVTSKYNISGAGKLKITPIIVTITASGKTADSDRESGSRR